LVVDLHVPPQDFFAWSHHPIEAVPIHFHQLQRVPKLGMDVPMHPEEARYETNLDITNSGDSGSSGPVSQEGNLAKVRGRIQPCHFHHLTLLSLLRDFGLTLDKDK